ncbi:MAG: thioredoxin domain-containing protein [Syntrophorhabdaceae bacterium]|nr:thioredoxin domain-containing protein [Syntrophorhabdaceae bacterium]
MLNDALRRAKNEDKGLILYFYSRYCSYCDMMEKEVLLNSEIKDMLKKDVVFLKIDGDVMRDIVKKYNVRGYPTVSLVEPSGKKITSVPGYISKRDFKKIILYLKGKHYKIMSFIDFMGQI